MRIILLGHRSTWKKFFYWKSSFIVKHWIKNIRDAISTKNEIPPTINCPLRFIFILKNFQKNIMSFYLMMEPRKMSRLRLKKIERVFHKNLAFLSQIFLSFTYFFLEFGWNISHLVISQIFEKFRLIFLFWSRSKNMSKIFPKLAKSSQSVFKLT